MVAGFLDAIAKVRQFKFHNDDDLYDRLSRRFSVVLLMLFTVVVSTKQYVGDPIACFAPAQFTGKGKKEKRTLNNASTHSSFNNETPRQVPPHSSTSLCVSHFPRVYQRNYSD